MKIAIYSRGGENLNMEDLRQFLGELTQARINTVRIGTRAFFPACRKTVRFQSRPFARAVRT